MGRVGSDLLDHLCGVVLLFFYENSVVGRCRIPRFERADSVYMSRVELMSLAMQSTRVRQTEIDIGRRGRRASD